MDGAAVIPSPAHRRSIPWIPLATALFSLSIYTLTLSPEVGPGDAAELALQAHRLGVTHPPGYPVHTFLGYLFHLVITDPARATNFLSACSTAIAIGFLSGLILTITRGRWIAAIAPLAFAFVPTVWESAVSTEVYNVNICFVAAALWSTLQWYRSRTSRRAIVAGVLVGLSFGTGLANGLLLPGWCVLVWRRSRGKRKDLAIACVSAVVVGLCVLSWSFFRSRSHPPLGTQYLPHRVNDFWNYVTAAQYRTDGSLPVEFYIMRLWDHARLFSASFLWLGAALALVGALFLWRRHRRIALAMILMFAANMMYFTWYPWPDYHEMVTPSYFMTTILLAVGADRLHHLSRRLQPARMSVQARHQQAGLPGRIAAACGSVFIIVAVLLFTGLRDHLSRPGKPAIAGGQTPVTDFVRDTFKHFPPDAVVVSEWDTFTLLLYFHETRGWRTDLRLIERSEWPRHYKWGPVDDWRVFVMQMAESNPVFVDVFDHPLGTVCTLEPAGPHWFRLKDCARGLRRRGNHPE